MHDDVDLGGPTIDHRLVTLDVGIQFAHNNVQRVGARKVFDLESLRDPEIVKRVEADIRNASVVPWSTNVHTHCEFVQSIFVDALEQHCPHRRRPRKQ